MKRVILGLVSLALSAASLSVSAVEPQADQRALIVVPSPVHQQELVAVLQEFVDRGADSNVTTPAPRSTSQR